MLKLDTRFVDIYFIYIYIFVCIIEKLDASIKLIYIVTCNFLINEKIHFIIF